MGNEYKLDKLEQLRKVDSTIVKLEKRARSKFISSILTKKLIALDSPNKGRYIKSLSCSCKLIHTDGKITSQYCGYRWCMVCNRIRTGKYINLYKPILETWGKSFMVTLTVPNCSAEDLEQTINVMGATVRKITDVMRKRKQKFKAVRKLEVTHNSEREDFHPHYHFIVEGEEQTVTLVQEWLKRIPECSEQAQHITEFNGDLREMFKYVTKLFTKDKHTGKYKDVDVQALDIILRALHGRRTFQNYGFNLSEDIREDDVMLLDDSVHEGELKSEVAEVREYIWYESGWINVEDGSIIADYNITDNIRRLLIETGLSNDS